MLKFKIIAVGKIKEKFYTDAINEYLKRLSLYSKTEIKEINEFKCNSQNPSPAEIQNVLEHEGDDIISAIPNGYAVVPLCIEGKELSSTELAEKINQFTINGNSGICFIIGGSFGLSDKVKSKADLKLSMSKMTFPHMLARVMLSEQLYRAVSILNNSKYHK